MSNEILEKIKQAIEGYQDDPKWEEIGKVVEVGDGIVKISGLKQVQSQEVLSIETDKVDIEFWDYDNTWPAHATPKHVHEYMQNG